MLYLLLFGACIWMVISHRINTDNTIKLIGIGCIAVGALVEIKARDSKLIELGILMYFSANLISAYFGRKNRRQYDKKVAQ